MTHIASFYNTSFTVAEITKLYSPILVLCETKTTDNLYERARNKWLDWKLEVKNEVLYFDKGSMIVGSTLKDLNDDSILATVRKKFLLYSPKARKIVNIPEKYQQTGRGVKDESLRLGLIYTKPEFIPQDVFSFDYRMMMSDTDYNSHVNHVTYVRLFRDVASFACKADKFSTLKKYICFYETEKLMFLSTWETFANDLVRIFVWEDSMSPWTVQCAMYCKDKPVYYAHANFKLYHIDANL